MLFFLTDQTNSTILGTFLGQEINHYDDVVLIQLAPDAYGPYGFEGHRAQLVCGMVMPAILKQAISKRCEEELADRASARFKQSQYNKSEKLYIYIDTIFIIPMPNSKAYICLVKKYVDTHFCLLCPLWLSLPVRFLLLKRTIINP